MKTLFFVFYTSFCILHSAFYITGCGEDATDTDDSPQPIDELQFGAVDGIITDARTGNPIPWATASLLSQTVQVEVDGRYVFTQIGYANALELTVAAEDYEPQTQTFALNVARLALNIALTPLTDPQAEIQEFLDALSELIESQDANNMEAIQAHFSETYVAADDPVTRFGLATGVIPANFKGVIPSVAKLFEEFDAIQFRFNEVQVSVKHTRQASARLNLEVITEKGPRPDRKEVVAECQIDFRKEQDGWKAIFWRLFRADVRL
jgi:hypothetical protein